MKAKAAPVDRGIELKDEIFHELLAIEGRPVVSLMCNHQESRPHACLHIREKRNELVLSGIPFKLFPIQLKDESIEFLKKKYPEIFL